TLNFRVPHRADSFLPPLVDDEGKERNFVYTPQASRSVRQKEPKYGDATDLVIRQYPALFHASTNIPAFIKFFSAIPNLSHLRISGPGQDPAYRYRRSTVDYALISLRIAIERSHLEYLDTLSLLPIHPGSLFYLHPLLGIGVAPNSTKQWAKIKKLNIHMDSFPFSRTTRNEHLKILHSYLRNFSPTLTRLSFRWKGSQGPSPLTLDCEPCLQIRPASWSSTSDGGSSVYSESSSSSSTRSIRRPLHFPKLRSMELENCVMDSSQVSSFVDRHARTLYSFAFEDILLRTGDWDHALEPLTHLAGSDAWKRSQRKEQEEVMDVPLLFPPVEEMPRSMERLERGEVDLARRAEDVRERMGLSRWFSKGRNEGGLPVKKKVREKGWGCEEGVKKFLRGAVFPWR
ncbi:hypothetical protein LTS18_008109, partial [Coniosporium uncinatum]